MPQFDTHLYESVAILSPDDVGETGVGYGDQANESLQTLMEHGFVAGVGLTPYFAGSLAVVATEPHIVEFCPDRAKRFPTLPKAKSWQGKGRGFVGIYDVFGNDGQPISVDQLRDLHDDDLRIMSYGWSGVEKNHFIEGADITTAYRNSAEGSRLAYERRRGPEDKFKLGPHLGEVVLGTAVHLFGANPKQISLETWESNQKAIQLYRDMGFVWRERTADRRPTLQPVGANINGYDVRPDIDKTGKPFNSVLDFRRAYLLKNHKLLDHASAA